MLNSARRAAAAVGVALVVVALAMALAAAGAGVSVALAAAGAAPFPVSVGAPYGRPIASDFLGLALEYRSIPAIVGSPSAVNPVLVQLIRNLAPTGSPVLRIGGQSTDRTWWPMPGTPPPLGVTYSLTPGWAAQARALAQAAGARLILGLELEADRPRIAAYEARELVAGIGLANIDALEIGNEPELYSSVPWYRKLHGGPIPWYDHDGKPVYARPRSWAPHDFYREFSSVLGELPSAPVAGPSVGLIPWLEGIRRYLSTASRVKLVAWHAYGLNQCVADRSSPDYPSVPNLLARPASRDLVAGTGPIVSLAHRVGARFRVDEMGSVTCNGRTGVSDTFASALWVMDALFALASSGVDGVNVHTFPGATNGLFDFDRAGAGWQAAVHPLYYGLLTFAAAAPSGSRLLRIGSGPQDELRAWATLGPDHRVRVLLINDSLRHPITAHVRASGATGPGAVERLLARSAYATQGVTLGGQSFGSRTATGVLAPPRSAAVAPRSGAYDVTVAAASAALLTVAARG